MIEYPIMFLPSGVLVLLVLSSVAKALPDPNTILLEVMSSTSSVGRNCYIKKDSETTLSFSDAIGFYVNTFDAIDGSWLYVTIYNTYSYSVIADQFATYIQDLPDGIIVAIALCNKGAAQLNEGAKTAIETLGSNQIRSLGDGESWAFIGIKGIEAGLAVETIDNTGAAITVSAVVQIQQRERPEVLLSAISGGYDALIDPVLSIDGAQLSLSGNSRGLNVIVFDEANGDILHRYIYDIIDFVSTTDDFAALIEGLPTGRVVAIAAEDNINRNTAELVKNAIQSIGGTQFDQGDDVGSYAIIGRKGAKPGSVPEAKSNQGPVQVQYYLRFPSQDNETIICDFLLTSYGTEQGQIMVDGVPETLDENSRGITLAFLKTDKCEVCFSMAFDINTSLEESDFLADVIQDVVQDRIIIATVMDVEAAQLTERAKVALESLGSGRIRNVEDGDAWVIIGRKGATKGSVPEMHGSEAVALQSSTPLTPSKMQSVITRI